MNQRCLRIHFVAPIAASPASKTNHFGGRPTTRAMRQIGVRHGNSRLLELPWLGLVGSHQPQLEEQPQLPDPQLDPQPAPQPPQGDGAGTWIFFVTIRHTGTSTSRSTVTGTHTEYVWF
jgi:hypothetical protein